MVEEDLRVRRVNVKEVGEVLRGKVASCLLHHPAPHIQGHQQRESVDRPCSAAMDRRKSTSCDNGPKCYWLLCV